MKTIRSPLPLLLALVLLAVWTGPARASLLLSGNFEAEFDVAPVATLSGSFEAVFDDTILSGSGFEQFVDQTILTSFSLVPNPLGVTMFDTSNVGATLPFLDGILTEFRIGGLINGATFVSPGTDDFVITFVAAGGSPLPANSASVSIAAFAGTAWGTQTTSGLVTVSSVPVPAPVTLLLFGLGLAGIGLGLRRR